MEFDLGALDVQAVDEILLAYASQNRAAKKLRTSYYRKSADEVMSFVIWGLRQRGMVFEKGDSKILRLERGKELYQRYLAIWKTLGGSKKGPPNAKRPPKTHLDPVDRGIRNLRRQITMQKGDTKALKEKLRSLAPEFPVASPVKLRASLPRQNYEDDT